ncbi:hypothetical protein BJ741DRAFT_535076, partial [Chytriomyces cf. hyalinus JEL632]
MTTAPPPAVPSRPKVTPGAMGLTNLGNTCFMNSALQCLSNSAHLTSYFLSERWNQELNPDNPLGMNGEVAVAYAGLVRELWKITNDDSRYGNQFAPRNFKSTIGRFNQTFLGYSQQDSQELLQFLLDGLHEDLNRIKKKPYVEQPEMEGRPDAEIASKAWELYRLRNDSQIVDLFQGEYKSRVECVECGNWSVKFDPYMFLSVPVPEKREVVVNVIVIGNCLTEFMKEEIMGDEDTWYCPKCKEHKKIKKKLDVWSVPDTLVLHLKRFSQTGRGFRSMSSNKIDALVDFPVNGLDLSDFVIGKDLLMYDLFAVSNHFGGLGGGHYTAYAKNAVDSQWYNFDDSHVSKISESSVVTPAAYMLFYQR